jgi:hypothetical protein
MRFSSSDGKEKLPKQEQMLITIFVIEINRWIYWHSLWQPTDKSHVGENM